MSDDTRPDMAPCPKCGKPSRLAAIHGPCLACTMGWQEPPTYDALAAELERVRTEHAELRALAETALYDDDAFNNFRALGAWLAAHPQDPKENP